MKKSYAFFVCIFLLLFQTKANALVTPQITYKNSHVIALRSDGSVWGWGGNYYGQIGDNTVIDKKTPVRARDESGIGYLNDIKQVSAGGWHTLALKNDGTLVVWGNNGDGQLGDGTKINKTLPVKVPNPSGIGYMKNVKQISAGLYHNVVLKEDGTVYTWGYNRQGQLGDGTLTDRTLPVQVKDPSGTGYLTGIIKVSTFLYHTAVLKNDGTVYAFGWNVNGQLGDGTTTTRSLPVQVKDPSGTGFLNNVKDVQAGFGRTVALKNDGSVWNWGNGDLGDNINAIRSLPIQVKGPGGIGYLTNIKEISVGMDSTFALKDDGSVYAWGRNDNGELDDGTTTEQKFPVKAKDIDVTGTIKNIESVGIGYGTSYAITNDGSVYTWGNNNLGQLGNNTLTGSTNPVKVLGGQSSVPYFNLLANLFSVTNSFISINPGVFSVTTPTISRGFAPYTLSENYPNLTADLSSINIIDWSGTGDGWHLTVMATQATDETGNELPINSLTIDAPSNVVKNSSNSSVNPTISSSAQLLNTTPVTLASASVGKGIGEYTINFSSNALHLNFDPNLVNLDADRSSTFTSTLTWSLISGP